MISNLMLSILENPSFDYIMQQIDELDKIRLLDWYEKTTGRNEDIEHVLNVFLWCCIEGDNAAETQNPQIFTKVFDCKATELNLSRGELSSLYFSHKKLFDVFDKDNKAKLKSGSLFIAFEGLDGSGKSTQINILSEKLRMMGRKVHVTAEPTNSATGGLIRDTLSNNYKRGAVELAALFLTDRISHNVNPAWGINKFLDEGVDVITDRYYYSSFAYQGLGTDLDWIMNMNLNCPSITKPDLCIYLDVDPTKCKNRMDSERTHLEIFENDEALMRKTRENFLEIFKKLNEQENIVIIDANRPKHAVADDILRVVMSLRKD